MSLFPTITFGICAACLFVYAIDKRCEIQMTNELAERRRNYGS